MNYSNHNDIVRINNTDITAVTNIKIKYGSNKIFMELLDDDNNFISLSQAILWMDDAEKLYLKILTDTIEEEGTYIIKNIQYELAYDVDIKNPSKMLIELKK